MVMVEENEYYQINCDKAVWHTGEQHTAYAKYTGSILKDADWIIETKDVTLLVIEYKNGTVYSSKEPFNPCEDKYIKLVASKYYDTLHFLNLQGKQGTRKYVYILEYPNDDAVTRKHIRNKIANYLPFKLQEKYSTGAKLIDEFDVMSIIEWNEKYPDFPITRTDKELKQST